MFFLTKYFFFSVFKLHSKWLGTRLLFWLW